MHAIMRCQGSVLLVVQGRIEIEEEGRRQIGPRLVNVNNHLVPESTPLGDGDWVSLSPELLDI